MHPVVAASPDPSPSRQQARLGITLGRHATLSAEVSVTGAGLLAVAGLVSSILLSTALVVHVAGRRADGVRI